jgi:hypothetical protein
MPQVREPDWMIPISLAAAALAIALFAVAAMHAFR